MTVEPIASVPIPSAAAPSSTPTAAVAIVVTRDAGMSAEEARRVRLKKQAEAMQIEMLKAFEASSSQPLHEDESRKMADLLTSAYDAGPGPMRTGGGGGLSALGDNRDR